ncbi:hypothetical protein [Sphingomonas crocodyli]|uniref:Uncharacterized protein n=1 Tax=Sphingomonas crocodyli TaxID=1979270 RepID=A0A437LXN2_9SPHN|nr:hypothetical protein [Sphingomonas crocodyli]RVT90127.1 hypothetical protein EOD43_17610 [Sphingomonas crocodyli]
MVETMIDRRSMVVADAYRVEFLSDGENSNHDRHLAVLILQAMREPTDNMNDAIADIMPERPHAIYWKAGIDAALRGA